ncbi:hypothetical protein J3E72DRAFT_384242 [Bipolaris maydis]|nr:hypothetical protein J3E73DRAFT_422237 [Bipolaris maydis]KAJ5062456.1 hypothetical protein J3E74DRAFT_416392 [Bipolaris maydis]KAJ6198732.1 hypothetical protein J3E72DRAFT_384242 [Bipolaris maydis]KAJ6283008.1 hypothetical protein J3E71DRAFT_398192 [Bipolaris maydis]
MAPLTHAEIKTKLLKSTGTTARIYKYTDLLGFRKLSKRSSRRGTQDFIGKPGEFYNASKNVAEVISRRYGSYTDLHERIKTQNDFREQEIEDLIENYGPIIWNDGQPNFVTKTDDQGEKHQSYPRYLIYTDRNDKVKIRTYIYCLVLQCTSCRMRGRLTNEIAVQAGLPRAASYSPEIGQSNATSPDLDTTSITSPRATAINTMSSVSSVGKRSRDHNHHNVAVAQMVPNTYTEGASSSSVMLQSTAVESVLPMRNSTTAADEDGQARETSCSDDPRMTTPPLDQVPSPNSDEEETDGHSIHNKRARYNQGETALTKFRLGKLNGSARRTARLKRRGYSSPWVGSDIPPVTTADAGEQENTEPAPESATNDNPNGLVSACTSHDSTDTAQECDNEVIAVTSVQEEQTRLTPSATPALETRHEEASSVQNSPRPSLAAEVRVSVEPTAQIVALPSEDQPENIQCCFYRARLASILPHAFDLQTQHTQVLEDTITLIADIRSLEATLSKSSVDNRIATYNFVLDQWLSLVAIYLTFRRAIDFHDTQEAWTAHLLSLPPTERWVREEPHHTASVSFQQWRLRNGSLAAPVWSREITSALLKTAKWRRQRETDDVDEMNRRVQKFNSGLIEWLG